MSSKHQIAKATQAMGQAISELTFALADHDPQYWRVYEMEIDSALLRIRAAESALVDAKILLKQEEGST